MYFYAISLVLISGFFTTYNNTYAADNCAYVRLDDPGKSMEKVPVANQGDFGVCYAVAASELTDAYRFSHSATTGDANFAHLTNFIETGFSDFDEYGTSGGSIAGAMEMIKKNGSCDRRVTGDGLDKKNNFLSKLQISFQVYSQLRSEGFHMREQFVHNLENSISCTPLVLGTSSNRFTPEIVARLIGSDDMRVFLKNVFDKACENHRQQVNLPKLHQPGWFRQHAMASSESVQKQINERLNQKEPVQPVGIEYCDNIFDDPNYEGNELDILGGVTRHDCKEHASVIMGRRRNSAGRCEFLIQNSWGNDCEPYSKKWTCDNGRVWVDADAIGKNVTGIEYFE
jgi:hypothetical protein